MGEGEGVAVCFSFLSILQRILLERNYVSSSSFLGGVSRVPQSGGRWGRAPVSFCSVTSSLPEWIVSHYDCTRKGDPPCNVRFMLCVLLVKNLE